MDDRNASLRGVQACSRQLPIPVTIPPNGGKVYAIWGKFPEEFVVSTSSTSDKRGDARWAARGEARASVVESTTRIIATTVAATVQKSAGEIIHRDIKNENVVFWSASKRDVARRPHEVLHVLLDRVNQKSSVFLFAAIEKGIPTMAIDLIAGALDTPLEWAMDLVGVSETTFRRKEREKEPLPEVAGHRVMSFFRIVAALRQLLEESGDRESVAKFDLESWVRAWMDEPTPALGDRTPAEMLRNPEGQRAVEELLERMRGGLPA